MKLFGITVLAVAIGLTTIAGTAKAADDLPDMGRAQQAFSRGLAQVQRNDLESARRSFASAYALVPSVDILWNLAMTERRLGRNVEALHHFRAYVGDATARADRKAMAESEILPELNDLTAHITVKAPDGARVTIDGAAVLSTTTDVEPGMHSISIANGGAARAIDAAPGSTIVVDLMPAPPIVTAASSAASAAAAAPIVVTTPTTPPPLSSRTEPSSSSTRTWTLATMGGVSVVLLAGGIAFASLASLDRGRAEKLYTQMQNDNLSCKQAGSLCGDHDSAQAAADRASAASTTMFVASGVLAGATIATWLLWPKSAPAAPAVAVTKDGGAIGMRGRF